jgi:hypothetical protein
VAPGPTSGEVVNPWWGQHLFSRAVFLELCILVFVAGVRFYLWTRGDPGLVCDAAVREASIDFPTHHRVDVMGVAAQWESWRLPRSGSHGGEGNHDPISRTAAMLRTSVWCGTFPYHTTGSPPLRFMLAD